MSLVLKNSCPRDGMNLNDENFFQGSEKYYANPSEKAVYLIELVTSFGI